MLYSLIVIAQAADPGAMCIKALVYLIFIGVAIGIAVVLLKNLKLLN